MLLREPLTAASRRSFFLLLLLLGCICCCIELCCKLCRHLLLTLCLVKLLNRSLRVN
jgi:hypothetical protein